MVHVWHRVRKRATALVTTLACIASIGLATGSQAQQLLQQKGRAASVDLVEIAQNLSMQDAYARSLFMFLRANPTRLDDQQFYVGFVSYLVSEALNDRCHDAFSNEFERRDFFANAFQFKPQFQQIIASKNIEQRFEVPFKVNTGRYDFNTGRLPLQNFQPIREGLDSNVGSYDARSCAQNMLRGVEISLESFPWNFSAVNESGATGRPAIPFGNALPMPDSDARILFERFGRQLYAIVRYQIRAANDGSHRVQVIATDGELFGLSSDAVVRVQTYAHPTLSQPTFLDIANKLDLKSEGVGLDATVVFKQEGFRAVAEGTGRGRGTGVTVGGTYPVTGSAAVGGTSFIMRIAAPQLAVNIQGLPNNPGAERFLTLFGAIDFDRITPSSAPVIGRALVLEVSPTGEMRESQAFRFTGAFSPVEAGDTPEVPAPVQADPALTGQNTQTQEPTVIE